MLVSRTYCGVCPSDDTFIVEHEDKQPFSDGGYGPVTLMTGHFDRVHPELEEMTILCVPAE